MVVLYFSHSDYSAFTMESRGLKDQGLYRVVGVNSKVNKLMLHGLGMCKCSRDQCVLYLGADQLYEGDFVCLLSGCLANISVQVYLYE